MNITDMLLLMRVVIIMDGVIISKLVILTAGIIVEHTFLGLEDQLLKMFSPYLLSPLQEILVDIHLKYHTIITVTIQAS